MGGCPFLPLPTIAVVPASGRQACRKDGPMETKQSSLPTSSPRLTTLSLSRPFLPVPSLPFPSLPDWDVEG
jgi:hypothetical protein